MLNWSNKTPLKKCTAKLTIVSQITKSFLYICETLTKDVEHYEKRHTETTYYRVRARIEDWGVDIKVGRLKDSDPIHKYLPDIFCPPDNLNDDGTAEFELGTTGMGYLTLSELDNYQKAINEAIIAVKKFSAVDWRNV